MNYGKHGIKIWFSSITTPIVCILIQKKTNLSVDHIHTLAVINIS